MLDLSIRNKIDFMDTAKLLVYASIHTTKKEWTLKLNTRYGLSFILNMVTSVPKYVYAYNKNRITVIGWFI